MTEEKKFRFITPVDRLPDFYAKPRPGIYDEIIEEFTKSGLKFAEVNECGRKAVTVVMGLRNRLKKSGNQNIRVVHKSKEHNVFIMRKDSSQ